MEEQDHYADPSERTLYRHVGCPYCERIVRVAQELDVEFTSRFVVPAHNERDYIKHISGGRSVPVLVDPSSGVTMSESANIVDYLGTTYGGSE